MRGTAGAGRPLARALWLCLALGAGQPGFGHDHTRRSFEIQNALLQAQQRQQSEPAPGPTDAATSCRLTLELTLGEARAPVAALVRVTNLATGKLLALAEQIQRPAGWYAVDAGATLLLPRTRLRIEALHGLETEQVSREEDLTGQDSRTLRVPLKRFYDAAARGLRSGNTHLHLMRLSFDEALRYLRVVPQADDLDLVFLSYLSRKPEDSTYISNRLTVDDLRRLSRDGLLFGNGEEHRHNFGPQGEGFGHVLMLDILKRIEPVSIGPGIMKEGSDGIPLQRGIREARKDGATIIWCHNAFGHEDVPNWVAGLVHAQNIFDGGSQGSYADTFYRYLDLGLRVPFSTGTDWFIYDFSRVYVPVPGELTSRKWLAALASGRSYITNGVFLELEADGKVPGDTLAASAGQPLRVKGRALGRGNFRRLELVHDGAVIHTVDARPVGGHHEALLDHGIGVSEPGWIALRIPEDAGSNEFGRPLFAHTGAIHVELEGRRQFRSEAARALVAEMQQSIERIDAQAVFAGDEEREAVLGVYRESIAALQQRIR